MQPHPGRRGRKLKGQWRREQCWELVRAVARRAALQEL